MKENNTLRDILVANALIKISPFVVIGGGLLIISSAVGSLQKPAAVAPTSDLCQKAAAFYSENSWRTAWEAQEIACGSYKGNAIAIPQCKAEIEALISQARPVDLETACNPQTAAAVKADANGCEAISEDLLAKADEVSKYYSGVGGSSDEYYKLRGEADALKQKALDKKCSNFDPERIRY
jgi:hypothetical protein